MSLLFAFVCGVAGLLWAAAAGAQPAAAGQEKAFAKSTVYRLDPAAGTSSRGLLVLLPSLGEPAHDVFHATRLAQEAAQQGFVVLVPALNDRICLDAVGTRFLGDAIGPVLQQYPFLAQKIVVGGFSAGGQLAFAYAETLVRDSAQRPWRLRAVLGVDPPLDLAVHWQRAQQHMDQRDCAPFLVYDQGTLSRLTHELGGSPAQFPEHYRARSAFARSDPAGGNARWLRAVPVRLYCEPDLAFWQAGSDKTAYHSQENR